MALPSSGPLSLNDIAGEFGGSAPHSLSEYYAGGGLVPAGTSGTYGAVPSSGTISIQNFYGTSSATYWLGLLGNNSTYGTTISALSVGADSSSNFYTLSNMFRDGIGNEYLITKQSTTGASQWQYVAGSVSSYGAAAYDSSGNTYLCTNTPTKYILKINSSGVIQWQKQINGVTSGGVPVSACVDSSGNLYIGDNDGSVYKYDSSGNPLWATATGLGGLVNGVAVDSSGNVYFSAQATYSGWYVLLTVKFNSSGTVQWARYLSNAGSQNINGNRVAVDSSGNVYATARVGSNGVLVKYDTNGTLQWQRGTTNNLYGVSCDTSGNVYVSGSYSSVSFLAKFDSSGTLQWQRTNTVSGQILGSINYITLTNNVISAYGNVFTDPYYWGMGFMNKLPSDGGKTGTYTVGGYTVTYAASGTSVSTSGYTGISPSVSASSKVPSVSASSLALTSVSITYSSTTI